MRRIALLVAVAAVGLLASRSAHASPVVRIRLHAHVDFSGQTGSVPGSRSGVRATGRVVVSARRDHGSWYVVQKTSTDRVGRYRVRFLPTRRGLYTLRIATPDRAVATYVIRVS
jgi:hypothetical protein